MKILILLLVGVLLAINALDAVGSKSRYAFAFATQGNSRSFKSFLKSLSWNSAVSFLKIQWGALVVAGRGKIGGQVASKNRSGSYMRNKVTPVNPRSASQTTVRNRLTNFSQAWRGLSEAQRAAWNAAVGDFSKTNIFGDSVQPTGFNLYQRLNNNLIRIGEAAINTPPAPAAITDIIIGALSAAAGAGTISLAYTAGADAGSEIEVWATPPVSAGVSFVKSEYRLIGQFTANAASPFNAAADYVAKFGSITGKSGQKIFFKTVAVNVTTGQSGVPQSTSAIIAA